MRLKDNDWSTLYRADELERRFDSGIFPSNGGQVSHFLRLARLGLLKYEGTGRDIDREVERDVHIWRLTPEAHKILREKQEAA